MTRAGWKEIAVLLVCVSIPCYVACGLREAFGRQILMVDFGEIYYGARCAIHHCDPYDPTSMLHEFRADGGRFADRLGPAQAGVDQIVVTRTDNLPTALFLAMPIALLPWGLAQNLWMIFTAALLIVAAFLTWDLGAGAAPMIWVTLAGFMLANSHLLFQRGNVAGVVESLCIIAVWCFLKERYVWAGVLLLGISLVLKPHDSGFVWLYFLLAGGALRKRALQTLAVTGILAACAVLWIAPISPHWMAEMHHNLVFLLAHGGASDPGPDGIGAGTSAAIIDIQGALSFLKDDPRFYNPVSYLTCGILLLVWGLKVLRKHVSMESARLALAAVSALSLLPVYHRSYDAIILLLALPACAMLWKAPGPKRWFALGLTSGGILITGTTPLSLLYKNARVLAAFASRFPGRLPIVLVLRPVPFVLLAMGCFYLWLFLRYTPPVELPKLDIASDARPATHTM